MISLFRLTFHLEKIIINMAEPWKDEEKIRDGKEVERMYNDLCLILSKHWNTA